MEKSLVISASSNGPFTFANEEIRNWQDQANCLGADRDIFFPVGNEKSGPAKEICRSCCVRLECLDFALVNGEKHGVWGGLDERERRRLRRNNARTAARVGVTAASAAVGHAEID